MIDLILCEFLVNKMYGLKSCQLKISYKHMEIHATLLLIYLHGIHLLCLYYLILVNFCVGLIKPVIINECVGRKHHIRSHQSRMYYGWPRTTTD